MGLSRIGRTTALAVAESRRQQQSQLQRLAIRKMKADVTLPIRPVANRIRKSSPHLLERMQDVLAGAEGVLTEVGTRAIRLAWLPSAERNPIGFTGRGVGQRVVGPDFLRVGRCEPHFLNTSAR